MAKMVKMEKMEKMAKRDQLEQLEQLELRAGLAQLEESVQPGCPPQATPFM
jgi:hypothetical protein